MAQRVLLAVIIVLALDWVFVGKFAAGFTDFDYRYWPPSWPRMVTIALATLTAAGSAAIFNAGRMPTWPLLLWAAVFAIWIVVAIGDLARQRRLGYREPPRYSAPDE
jgi:hypothetical protein